MGEESRSERCVFSALGALCASPGYIHILAFFSFRDNFISLAGEMTVAAMEESYKPSRLIRTEFSTLVGLLLRHPVDFSLPAPEQVQQMMDQTEFLLKELHDCFKQPMFKEASETAANSEESSFLWGEVLSSTFRIFKIGRRFYR